MPQKIPNDKQIKAIIRRTVDIVEEVEDAYRLKAFEVILSKLWDAHAKESTAPKEEKREGEAEDKRLGAKIKKFADKCGLAVAQLRNIYAFEKEKPIFIVPLQGSLAEKQFTASRYLLTAYDEVYGIKWINLHEVLGEHGIGSLGNLSANLKRHREAIRLQGRGKARQYRLVDSAKRETFRMIRELAAAEGTQS